ncbi:MAG: hypothetical protein IJ660_05825 [Alphaproteobacteria bacterium]|nr:hypothetical protein [Alphaproteobacteria bacterium]
MNGDMYSKFMENYVSTTMEEYFAKNLDPERQNIREILKSISEDAEKIYLAGIYILQINDFPARQSVVAHCFRELIDAIIRTEETLMKSQVVVAIKTIDFVKKGQLSDEEIEKFVNDRDNWQKFKSLQNEKAKLSETLLSKNPKLALKIESSDKNEREKTREDLQTFIENVKKAKRIIDSLRHFNKRFHTISNEDLLNNIQIIESYIKQLEQPQYMEVKEVLDDILEETNTKAD